MQDMPISEAQRRANRKMDTKRPPPVGVRLTEEEIQEATKLLRPGEKLAGLLRRLLRQAAGLDT